MSIIMAGKGDLEGKVKTVKSGKFGSLLAKASRNSITKYEDNLLDVTLISFSQEMC